MLRYTPFISSSLLIVFFCLYTQDSEGKTALHSSVFSQRRRSVELLLQKGADPTLYDFEMMTPIHNAAGIGFVA